MLYLLLSSLATVSDMLIPYLALFSLKFIVASEKLIYKVIECAQKK